MDNVVDIILYVCFFVNSDEDCFKCFSFGCVQIATSKAVLFEKKQFREEKHWGEIPKWV